MAKNITKEFEKRVEAGAAYLSVVHPHWYKHVDLNILDLGSAQKCILGELYGDFDEAEEDLHLDREVGIKGNGAIPQSEALGLLISNALDPVTDSLTAKAKRQYKILTLLWKKKIKKLLTT